MRGSSAIRGSLESRFGRARRGTGLPLGGLASAGEGEREVRDLSNERMVMTMRGRLQIEADLVDTEQRITVSNGHIARQHEVMLRLRRCDQSSQGAQALLDTFEQVLGMQIVARDMLRRELDALE